MAYYLIPHPDGTWDVRKEGASKDSFSGLSSLSAARNVTQGLGAENIAVKGLDGKIDHWE